MNIDTVSGSKLQAALLAAFKLDGDTKEPFGAEEAAAACASVLCAFCEVIAAAVFPAMPMVEGVAMVADDIGVSTLDEMRGLCADLALYFRSAAPMVTSEGPLRLVGKLSPYMKEIASHALCNAVATGTTGLSIAKAGEQLADALMKLNDLTVPD